MNRPDPIDVLNHLLRMHFRSLPIYLQGDRLWSRGNDSRGAELLAQIADDHKALSQRLAAAVYDRGGLPDGGQFPTPFTGMHDLALDYVLGRVRQSTEHDLKALEHSVAELSDDPAARVLAEEALSQARRHLDMLAAARM